MMRWMYDWDEAAKQPVLAALTAGVLAGGGMSVITYFRIANHSAPGAFLMGAAAGVIVAGLAYGRATQAASSDGHSAPPPEALSLFDAALLLAAAVVFVVGVLATSWAVVGSALLLGALGGTLILIRLISRRRFADGS